MDSIHLEVPWTQIIGFLLASAFALWAWVLRKYGEQHITTIKELVAELKEMRREVNALSIRVAVIEARTHIPHE